MISAAGANTVIGINTAQAIPPDTLLSIIHAVGDKRLNATFNGAQLTGNSLQQVAAAAGLNTTITVNTAQAAPPPSLIAGLQAAGTKRFNAIFNGTQLSGNYLQQAVDVAGQGTTISVNSAHSVPLQTLLSIVAKAG